LKKLAISTLGCKVNQYESEALAQLFIANGYTVVSENDDADVCIINTCSVTNMSDRKSRKMIRRCTNSEKNPIVVVTGCYSEANPEEVSKIDGVSIVTGTNNKRAIFDLVESQIEGKKKIIEIFDEGIGTSFNFDAVTNYLDKTRAIIKIQDGCNSFCSYCIIPFVRGRCRSREMSVILDEVEKLSKNGYKEIVLAGIHVCNYGMDKENLTLSKLLVELEKIDGIERIRLSSIEPSAFTKEFYSMYERSKKLCPHFHISLQSGSDSVIKRMNRHYSRNDFLAIIDRLRNINQNTTITTDIIVGFPGETDDEFEQTIDLIKKAKFLKAHIFKYSKRSGTVASDMPDQIDAKIADVRSKKAIKTAEIIENEVLNSFVGKSVNVLFQDEKEDFISGFSENYIPVSIPKNTDLIGKICRVKINKIQNLSAYAELV
jgi:threonylcarbamoyladenosine tRNA methylthiotransferase MtaB